MLALVPNVVVLEAEEKGEPVEEVHVLRPSGVRWLSEVTYGLERGGHGSDLREAERWVLGEEVVDGDDVVGLGIQGWWCRWAPPRLGRVRARWWPLPVAHDGGLVFWFES